MPGSREESLLREVVNVYVSSSEEASVDGLDGTNAPASKVVGGAATDGDAVSVKSDHPSISMQSILMRYSVSCL